MPFKLQNVFMNDLKKMQFKKVVITGGKYKLDVLEIEPIFEQEC